MELSDLPGLNAGLNGLAGMLLLAGYGSIRARKIALHRRFMLAACTASTLFLISYLIYHFHQPTTPYSGQGALRYVYFAVLIPHIVLAVALVPLVPITLYRALKGRLERHRRLARITLPIWLYVSVTGVVVYLMLYRL